MEVSHYSYFTEKLSKSLVYFFFIIIDITDKFKFVKYDKAKPLTSVPKSSNTFSKFLCNVELLRVECKSLDFKRKYKKSELLSQ